MTQIAEPNMTPAELDRWMADMRVTDCCNASKPAEREAGQTFTCVCGKTWVYITGWAWNRCDDGVRTYGGWYER